jgi:hypothetical protein
MLEGEGRVKGRRGSEEGRGWRGEEKAGRGVEDGMGWADVLVAE